MSPTLVFILLSIGLIALVFIIRYIVNQAANKAKDAYHNSRVRSDEQKNPPKQESLADRYRNTK